MIDNTITINDESILRDRIRQEMSSASPPLFLDGQALDLDGLDGSSLATAIVATAAAANLTAENLTG